jgi:hypothetical protein
MDFWIIDGATNGFILLQLIGMAAGALFSILHHFFAPN